MENEKGVEKTLRDGDFLVVKKDDVGPDGSYVPYKKKSKTFMCRMTQSFRCQNEKGDWSTGQPGDYLAGGPGDWWAVSKEYHEENYESAWNRRKG